MKVELITVIEISNFNENVKSPDLGPFWKYADDWEKYNRLSNTCAGFSDDLKPYLKGSGLYKINEISDFDLLKAIQKEIIIQQTEENRGIEDLVCPFDGGYILKVDDKDIYFPQCCGNLADIEEWENLVAGNVNSFFAGHPSPRVTERENNVCFDFVNTEFKGESFVPPIPVENIEIDKSELETAIKNTKKELEIFANRLREINQIMNLNIPDIEKRLIFGIEE